MDEEVRQRLEALEARIAAIDLRTVGDIRLGPRPETEEDKTKRQRVVDALVADVKAQLHEHEIDRDGRQICTTSGEAPSKVRAGQTESSGQYKSYIVLCEEERNKGFVRPYRDRYQHRTCGGVTTMGRALSETYARDPSFYGATFCVSCNAHFPVAEFTWSKDGEQVGS